MLRCVLKQENLYFSIFWIKATKDSVITSTLGKSIMSEMVGFMVNDAHTTYHTDGIIHTRFASEQNDGKSEIFLTARHDQVSSKTIVNQQPIKKDEKGRGPLNWLLPQYVPPLAYYCDNQVSFSFPTQALNVPLPIERAKQILQPIEYSDWRPNTDILIDMDIMGEGLINVAGYIAHCDFILPQIGMGEKLMRYQCEKNIINKYKIGMWVTFNQN